MGNFTSRYTIGKHFNDYKESFPFLDYTTFCKLEIKGKLGALLRGERIELPKEGILIEENWWRKEIYKSTGIPAFLSS
ncbi:hypothetical protein [Mangrovimonas sp. DI 80]|uniref:hypothetical protein n=1 Tax=Mangrovimonas sp. DI 80 TaxID=1779330 RepID=UPI00097874D9|nr:hypothetical protein [Mangrovimonas sp. DI 80]OMP30646.1 hypothetical protein BKM32_10415 [Mangrovimonas sp. DI 80]